MENKKSTGKTALIVLLLIVTIASLVLATYAWAKYTTNTQGNTVANVAKWNVAVSTEDSKFSQTYTHVLPEMLAPGTSGQLDTNVTIGNDTEVDVAYSIYVEEVIVKYRETKENDDRDPATIPTNMTFANAKGDDITSQIRALVNQNSQNRENGVVIAEGTIDYTTAAEIEAALTWDWQYHTGTETDPVAHIYSGDEADTRDGQNPVEITLVYRVDAWQVQPVTTTTQP